MRSSSARRRRAPAGRSLPPAHELLALAAVTGRTSRYDLLARACRLPEAALVRCLDECRERQLVREHGLDSYTISHALLRVASAQAQLKAGGEPRERR